MIDRRQWLEKVVELAPWDGEISLGSATFHVDEKVTISIRPPYDPVVYPYPSVYVWYDPQSDVQYTAYKDIRKKNPEEVVKEAMEFYNDFIRRYEVRNDD